MRGAGADGESASIAAVRAALERFDAGDVEGMLRFVHPDAEFVPTFIAPGDYRGHAAIRAVFEGAGSRRRWSVEGPRFSEIGDRVVVDARLHAITAVGTAKDLPIAWVFDLDDGLIVRMRSFVHRSQALEAIC